MENIKNLLKEKKITLVDVRNGWEFDEDHINNSVNIPLDQVSKRLDEFKKPGNSFVLFCQSGNRSNIAVTILKQSGITEIYNGGGIADIRKLIMN